MNVVLALLVIAIACLTLLVWLSPSALRHLAAWSLARGFYLENLRAEREHWRELADEKRVELKREFGVAA